MRTEEDGRWKPVREWRYRKIAVHLPALTTRLAKSERDDLDAVDRRHTASLPSIDTDCGELICRVVVM